MEKIKKPKTFLSSSNRNDVESLKTTFINILEQVIAKDEFSATKLDLFKTLAYLVRAKMMKKWIKTQQKYHFKNKKRVYYLSLEYLMGRLLEDSILNIGIEENLKEALSLMNINYEEILEEEHDAGLGNGGLGRLAACFLDSMATLDIPSHGYGIRYNYGIFDQDIEDGRQVEVPDNWLKHGNPWEIERSQYSVRIKFYGKTAEFIEKDGSLRTHWVETKDVIALPYDTPVPGYGNETINTLRLWSSRAVEEFDLEQFNKGDYLSACEDMIYSENISKILYPNDNLSVGRELRLKQQYFFVSASIQDIIRRFKVHNKDFEHLPDKVVIQLNDTHPALAIPELLRILIDEEYLSFESAWEIVQKVFAYSNHTLLPEALEKWSVQMFSNLLPRHMELIYQINHVFLEKLKSKYPDNSFMLKKLSIIEEGPVKMIRMAYLATIASFSVNGVSELHTKLIKSQIFKDFYEIFPEKFNNKTNGITPRRWLFNTNEPLSNLIEKNIGNSWILNLQELKKLVPLAEDQKFRCEWEKIKNKNKEILSEYILNEYGISVNVSAIFDIQAKRIHEYKRQLLFLMHAIYLYNKIRKDPSCEITPRVMIFAGKAAPGYVLAKNIIHLINNVADVINNDPICKNKLNVLFLKNYNVSLASLIIPACDLSEQISTAGFEASGTGNMKFALNGALTIGTLDGANIEMLEEVGDENMFIFGSTHEEIKSLRSAGYNPWDVYNVNSDVKEIIDMIKNGFFSSGKQDVFYPIFDSLMNRGDYYMHLADFSSYIKTQNEVSNLFPDRDNWIRKSIINTANMGKFSSDRTIMEYAREIWKILPKK